MDINENVKIVIVVRSTLGIGLAANRAACLATGLAKHVPDMIGQNLTTKDNVHLLGFTQVPIPILSAKPEISFFEMLEKAKELDCKTIVFLTRAQGMRSYQEYINSVAETNYKDLDIDAIAIYGTPKSVTKITGNLPSLR